MLDIAEGGSGNFEIFLSLLGDAGDLFFGLEFVPHDDGPEVLVALQIVLKCS